MCDGTQTAYARFQKYARRAKFREGEVCAGLWKESGSGRRPVISAKRHVPSQGPKHARSRAETGPSARRLVPLPAAPVKRPTPPKLVGDAEWLRRRDSNSRFANDCQHLTYSEHASPAKQAVPRKACSRVRKPFRRA